MQEGSTQFSVFGPLEVRGRDGPVPCGGRTERAVLCALLLSPGEPMDVDRLSDLVWSAPRMPKNPCHALHTHVMRLRGHLGTSLIGTDHHGYHASVDPGCVDAHRFVQFVEAADVQRRAGNLVASAHGYRLALAECGHRPAWQDLAPSSSGQAEQARLYELRLETEEHACAVGLMLHPGATSDLERLALDQPLRELRWVLLMVAQSMAGRQVDALRSFARARDALKEVGLSPGPALRSTEQMVLAHGAPTRRDEAVRDLIAPLL